MHVIPEITPLLMPEDGTGSDISDINTFAMDSTYKIVEPVARLRWKNGCLQAANVVTYYKWSDRQPTLRQVEWSNVPTVADDAPDIE